MTSKTAPTGAVKICVIAGETSGDVLGGRLMAALKKISCSPVEFLGVGGGKMREQGLDSFFPMTDLSIMGISEVLPQIPKILKRINETVAYIKLAKPDAVVTIDSPDFSLRVAKRLYPSNARLIHYVAPSVWAWKAWRARRMSRFLDHVLTLFHFEPPYFQSAGLKSKFVGHPILESGAGRGNGERFRSVNGIPTDAILICILPGSRLFEVTKHLPIMEQTLGFLQKQVGICEVIIPLADNVSTYVKATVREWPIKVNFAEGDKEKHDALAASNAALAASGTVSLELAMAGVPYVTIYKMKALSNLLAKMMVKLKYVNIINILLDEEVVPELLLEKCKPHLISPHLLRCLNDQEFKSKQRKKFLIALELMGADKKPPSERAAQAVLDALNQHPTSYP